MVWALGLLALKVSVYWSFIHANRLQSLKLIKICFKLNILFSCSIYLSFLQFELVKNSLKSSSIISSIYTFLSQKSCYFLRYSMLPYLYIRFSIYPSINVLYILYLLFYIWYNYLSFYLSDFDAVGISKVQFKYWYKYFGTLMTDFESLIWTCSIQFYEILYVYHCWTLYWSCTKVLPTMLLLFLWVLYEIAISIDIYIEKHCRNVCSQVFKIFLWTSSIKTYYILIIVPIYIYISIFNFYSHFPATRIAKQTSKTSVHLFYSSYF